MAWEKSLQDALASPCHIPECRRPRILAWLEASGWPLAQAFPPLSCPPFSALFLPPEAKGSVGAASPLLFRGAVLELERKRKGAGISSENFPFFLMLLESQTSLNYGLSTLKCPALCQPPPEYRDGKTWSLSWGTLSRREETAYRRVLDSLVGCTL